MLIFEERQQNTSIQPLWKLSTKSWQNCCQRIKPKVAIKLDTVPLDKTHPEETVLPEDGLHRYLYQPGKQQGDQKRRATDLIWSKNTYRIDRIVQKPGNCVLYYLQCSPDRAFVREELMHISEDTQVPPDWLSEWK